MLKAGILNPHLNSLISRVRHTNTLVIADRGFPFWPMIETVDISLVDDVPTVLQVLAALRGNFVIGKAWMAREFLRINSPKTRADFARALSGIDLKHEPHVEFKLRVPRAIGLIRTGDTTQYTGGTAWAPGRCHQPRVQSAVRVHAVRHVSPAAAAKRSSLRGDSGGTARAPRRVTTARMQSYPTASGGTAGEQPGTTDAPMIQAAIRQWPSLRALVAAAAGYAHRTSARLRHEPPRRDTAPLLSCVKGGGWCELLGRVYPVRSGDLVILPPGHLRVGGPHVRTPWSVHWVEARGDRQPDYLRALGATLDQPLLRLGDEPSMQSRGPSMDSQTGSAQPVTVP